MKSGFTIFASPLLCLGLLGGMLAEQSTRVKAPDAEPYHERARIAIESIDYALGDFRGAEEKLPTAAVKLLKPNATMSRAYSDIFSRRARRAHFLIVQCRDSRDMAGHWPPNCYPNSGSEMVYEAPRDWKVGDRVIAGMEYHFNAASNDGSSQRRAVYNFMIVPEVGIVRDMKGIRAAAEDYQRRYLGAAQVQVVMNANLTQVERDEIFAELLEPNLHVIDVLTSGGLQ